jgi:hypothetical protein
MEVVDAVADRWCRHHEVSYQSFHLKVTPSSPSETRRRLEMATPITSSADVTVEYRSAEGRIGLLPQFAAELVQRNPAVHGAERDRPDRRLGDYGRGRRESTFPAVWSGARLLV